MWLRVDCRLNNRYCGRCCYKTEMPLSREDIKRIEDLGYPRDHFLIWRKGLPRLRNTDGHCVFLDVTSGKCMIYPHRPEGCRLYPLIYTRARGVMVDPLCPKAGSIPISDVRRLAPVLIKLLRKLEEEYYVKLL